LTIFDFWWENIILAGNYYFGVKIISMEVSDKNKKILFFSLFFAFFLAFLAFFLAFLAFCLAFLALSLKHAQLP